MGFRAKHEPSRRFLRRSEGDDGMSPLFLILYVVIVTLVLTLVMPRLREANPQLARGLIAVGVVGLLALALVMFL
jgi:hypothetical protein